MCRAQSDTGRRCPSHTAEARRAARVVKRLTRAVEVAPPGSSHRLLGEFDLERAQQTYRDLVSAIRHEAEFASSLARAEEDGAAFDELLAAEPTPLRRDLARIGLAGLARRHGFDHRANLEVMLTPQDLVSMPLPPGVPGAPALAPSAGEVRIAVRASTWPTPESSVWTAVSGLRLMWSGDGDVGQRRTYLRALANWFSGYLARYQQP